MTVRAREAQAHTGRSSQSDSDRRGSRRRTVKLRTAERVVVIASVVVVGYAVLVGALIWLKPPPVRFAYAETASTRAGEAIFRREGCLSCHELFGNGTTFGPPLDGTGSRREWSWLRDYLRSPRAGVGERTYRLRMPSYDTLEEGELDALTNYLGALRELDSNGRFIEPVRAATDAGQ